MRRTKEDAEKTRLNVIDAALTLFSRNGYSGTTLAMIAAEAGYSRGPIYWHFRNKDDLYQAVLSYSQDPLADLLERAKSIANPLDAVTFLGNEWLALLTSDQRFRQSFEILLNKTELTETMTSTLERERALTQRIVSGLEKLLARAQEDGDVVIEVSPSKLAVLLYAMLMGITQSWLFAPNLFDLDAERAFFVERMQALVSRS